MENDASSLVGLPGVTAGCRARLTGRLCRQAERQVASGRSVSAVAQYQVSCRSRTGTTPLRWR